MPIAVSRIARCSSAVAPAAARKTGRLYGICPSAGSLGAKERRNARSKSGGWRRTSALAARPGTPRHLHPPRLARRSVYNRRVRLFSGIDRVAQVLAPLRAGLHAVPRGAVRRRDAAARPAAARHRRTRGSVVLQQETATPLVGARGRELRRRGEKGDAGGRQHLHQQGSAAAQPARRRPAVAPLLSRTSPNACRAARDEPRLGRHRRRPKATCSPTITSSRAPTTSSSCSPTAGAIARARPRHAIPSPTSPC